MGVLLDTDFLVSFWNADERRHDEAVATLEELRNGARGQLYLTTFIVDEAATLMMRRSRSLANVRRFVRFLLGLPPAPKVFAILYLDQRLFDRAAERFLASRKRLSFTDCTSLEIMRDEGIEAIATFDEDFRGLAETLP